MSRLRPASVLHLPTDGVSGSVWNAGYSGVATQPSNVANDAMVRLYEFTHQALCATTEGAAIIDALIERGIEADVLLHSTVGVISAQLDAKALFQEELRTAETTVPSRWRPRNQTADPRRTTSPPGRKPSPALSRCVGWRKRSPKLFRICPVVWSASIQIAATASLRARCRRPHSRGGRVVDNRPVAYTRTFQSRAV